MKAKYTQYNIFNSENIIKASEVNTLMSTLELQKRFQQLAPEAIIELANQLHSPFPSLRLKAIELITKKIIPDKLDLNLEFKNMSTEDLQSFIVQAVKKYVK